MLYYYDATENLALASGCQATCAYYGIDLKSMNIDFILSMYMCRWQKSHIEAKSGAFLNTNPLSSFPTRPHFKVKIVKSTKIKTNNTSPFYKVQWCPTPMTRELC